MVLSKNLIEAHVERILDSPQFKASAKYSQLLRYLVDRSIADETPKEYDIAVDVFSKDPSYDPTESSSVRVSVHELRKKLREYYLENEPSDGMRLSLPKGAYRLSFGTPLIEAAPEEPSKLSSPTAPVAADRRPMRWIVALAALAAISLALNLWLWRSKDEADAGNAFPPAAASFVWQELAQGPQPILIALGDFFFFAESANEVTEQAGRFIRDIRINSPEDLARLNESAGGSFVPTNLTYLPKSVAFAMQSILPQAEATGKPVTLKLMSDVTGEDLRQNHIIYVGFLRTMGPLRDWFLRASSFESPPPFEELRYKRTGETFSLTGDVFGQSGDYGLFAKLAGPGTGQLLIFTGINDISILHAARALCDPDEAAVVRQAVVETLGDVPAELEVLFEVSGFSRVDLGATIKIASALPFKDESSPIAFDLDHGEGGVRDDR